MSVSVKLGRGDMWVIARALVSAEKTAKTKAKRAKHPATYAMECADYSMLFERMMAHWCIMWATGNGEE